MKKIQECPNCHKDKKVKQTTLSGQIITVTCSVCKGKGTIMRSDAL